ncbi:hypothetical protein [Clostridium scatologenes]|uniref:hypothetical protein n=1 Tax=Clostridium scatologenes TaxID=1548 RepID=UPI00048B3F2E
MKIDRLLGILNVLANTERITIQELAERFEVILEYDITNEFFLTDKKMTYRCHIFHFRKRRGVSNLK